MKTCFFYHVINLKPGDALYANFQSFFVNYSQALFMKIWKNCFIALFFGNPFFLIVINHSLMLSFKINRFPII